MRALKGILTGAAAGALALGTAAAPAMADTKPADQKKQAPQQDSQPTTQKQSDLPFKVRIQSVFINEQGWVNVGENSVLLYVFGCGADSATATSPVLEPRSQFDDQIILDNPAQTEDGKRGIFGTAAVKDDAPIGKTSVTVTCEGKSVTQPFTVLPEDVEGPPEIYFANQSVDSYGWDRGTFAFGLSGCSEVKPKSIEWSSDLFSKIGQGKDGSDTLYYGWIKKNADFGQYSLTLHCGPDVRPSTTIRIRYHDGSWKQDDKKDDPKGDDKKDDPKGDDKKNKPELGVIITDGYASDGQVELKVTGCQSDKLTVTSEAFSATTWHPKNNTLTATMVEGLPSGKYDVKFDCAGQKPVVNTYTYTTNPGSDDSGDTTDMGNTDQTSVVPEGGVQTGGGGTAATTGTAAAGWAVLPLLAVPMALALRRAQRQS